jgi:RNA polymerase sigma-70 factor, ECF subfamily
MYIQNLSDEEIIIKIIDLKKLPNDCRNLVKSYYETIYNRYYKKAFFFCRHYGLKYDDSHDATQEAFINLYKSIHSFKRDKQFKPWFFTIVYNCVKNKYNHLKKNRYVELDAFQELDKFPSINIFEKVHEKEHIRSIINSLPEKYKKVIILKTYSGMDSSEIADIIRISEKHVYNLLNQAYEVMRKF